MEMGRQISVPAGWAKEKGASWNQGESASCVEGAHRVGSSGGGLLALQSHRPVCTVF